MAYSGMRALKQAWMHGVEGNGLQWDTRPKVNAGNSLRHVRGPTARTKFATELSRSPKPFRLDRRLLWSYVNKLL